MDEREAARPAPHRAPPEARRRRCVAATDPVTPGMRVLLDSSDVPAVVFNGRLDVLATNRLGAALHATVLDDPGTPNLARFLFLDEHRSGALFPHRERIACDTVAILHTDAGAGQILTVSTPMPGTPDADTVRLLGSWNADTAPVEWRGPRS